MIKLYTMWKIIGFILLLIVCLTSCIVISVHEDSSIQFQNINVFTRTYSLLAISNLITLICLGCSIIDDFIKQSEKNLL